MRRARPPRRTFLELHRITIADYIILVTSLLTVISLFLPWFVSSIAGSHSEWAFTYSEVAAVIIILFFLVSVFLVVYPALSSDLALPELPFSTSALFMLIGALLLLLFAYELGKYDCIACQGVSRGFGLIVGSIATIVFIIGAVIKWGSRPGARL